MYLIDIQKILNQTQIICGGARLWEWNEPRPPLLPSYPPSLAGTASFDDHSVHKKSKVTPSYTNTMNFHLFTSITLVVVAMMALELPLTSGLALLSPLILRVNPSVIIDRMNKTPSSPAPSADLSLTSCSKGRSDEPATIISRPTAIVAADFGRDEELMRYKHELLSAVYEKALTRGFE